MNRHAEFVRLSATARKMRQLRPKPTIQQIADMLGCTYAATRHYVYGNRRLDRDK